MIYIKRFLYLLFMIAMNIVGSVILLTTIITFPFLSAIDYIVNGEITKDYFKTVAEWLDDVSNKLKPE